MEHSLDSVQALSQGHIDMITKDVNLVIQDALKSGDPEVVFNYGKRLNETGQAVWVAVAHLVYEMNKLWGKEFKSDDNFITVAAVRWNKSPETIRRYVEIWEWVIAKPNHSSKRLAQILSKPMQGLWYIKQAAREGQLVESDWEAISKAPNISSLREIGQRVRGEVGRAVDSLKIMMEDDGTIKARRKGAYKVVGWLNLDSGEEVVEEAIERISNKSGVFRR